MKRYVVIANDYDEIPNVYLFSDYYAAKVYMSNLFENQIQMEEKDNIPINCHETFCEGEYSQVMRNDGTRWVCQIVQEKKLIRFEKSGNRKSDGYENLIEDMRDDQENIKKDLITRQMEAINAAKRSGLRRALWYGYNEKYATIENEVQQIFENKGYKVKLSEYIFAGVWQPSKYICW